MDAFYFYGFWILVGVVFVLLLLRVLGKNSRDILQKKCVYWENKTLSLEQARKESSDIFSFAVRYLVAASDKGIVHFKRRILHGDLSQDGSVERKSIDKIVFLLEQDEPTE